MRPQIDTIKNLKRFMLDSNRIEGENRINPGDIEAAKFAIAAPIIGLSELLRIHSLLGAYLNKPWVGQLRTINVHVGRFCPVDAGQLQLAMEEFIHDLPLMTSWTAHNKFEKIHPFQDLNGRTGRLIWLNKAIWNEGYSFKIPFLQAYYYQTLYIYEGNKTSAGSIAEEEGKI